MIKIVPITKCYDSEYGIKFLKIDNSVKITVLVTMLCNSLFTFYTVQNKL